MKAEILFDKLQFLLVCSGDSDIVDKGRNDTSESHRQDIAHEYERFLVAWILLTRLSQEQLDRAWEKYGNSLSYFANCMLTNIDNNIDIVDDDHAMPKNGSDSGHDFLSICCIRLLCQVMARLKTPPSKDLRRKLYNSWKHMSTTKIAKNVAENSPATATTKLLNSTIIALNVDVCSVFLVWMERDVPFFQPEIIMKDVWKTYIAAHAIVKKSAAFHEQENRRKQNENASIETKSEFKNNDEIIMFNVFESVLGRPTDTEKIHNDSDGDIYTIVTLQRLIFVIFELLGTKCVPEELVRNILRWCCQNNQEEGFSPDLRDLWHGWLMKNIGECVSKQTTPSTLLRDPVMMDAIQTIALAHIVSPNRHALRTMAWQSISQIMKAYSWDWIQESSMKTSICTWCRLACGEWKIQLERDKNLASERSSRLSILDGCGRVIISVVQYLVDDRSNKLIHLETKSHLTMKQSLEETLSSTSTYLNIFPYLKDDVESVVIVNLWSELFSEIDLSTSKEADNTITCLGKLLLVSSDESLVKALVHYMSTHCTEEKCLYEHVDFESVVIGPAMVFMERFWTTFLKPCPRKKWYPLDTMQWACVATEILAENKPESTQRVVNAIFDAASCFVESFQFASTNQRIELKQRLRIIIEPCLKLLKLFGDTFPTKNMPHIISSAIKIMEDKK